MDNDEVLLKCCWWSFRAGPRYFCVYGDFPFKSKWTVGELQIVYR